MINSSSSSLTENSFLFQSGVDISFDRKPEMRKIGNIQIYSISRPSYAEINELIKNTGHDCYVLTIAESGTLRVRQESSITVTDTSLLLWDMKKRTELLPDPAFTGKICFIPKQMLSGKVANTHNFLMHSTDFNIPLVRMIIKRISDLLKLSARDCPATQVLLAEAFTDIFSALCEQAGRNKGKRISSAEGRRAEALTSAKVFMIINIHNPDLSFDSVAEHANISRRTLDRLFRSKGVSPSRWLWHQRLELAKKILEQENTRVTDVAINCGFRDFSHFSRTFKARFGISPSLLMSR